MKFLLFSDLHYFPGVFMRGTWEDLRFLQRRAEEEKCEFMIHAGDLCHGPSGEKEAEYVKAYNDFHIPSYHCLGNHDTDHTPYEETLKAYHMPDGHYYFDHGGYRMIILNPNHYCVEGQYVQYSMGNYYPFGKYRDFIPSAQVEWLEKTIAGAPGPCVIISHESFEREANGVQNGHLVREVINRANERKKHSVILCINGHYHRDNIRILDNVCWLDMNSASYDWVEKAHDLYPEELCRQHSALNHTVVYTDPLHAIVTLEGSRISIEGMKSSMFMGVTREMTGNAPFDAMGRPVTPTVQSAQITLG